MEPIKNHYLDIPEERKLRIFREEDERFYSFWERMLDEKQSFYRQPLKRMKGDAWDSLEAFFTASEFEQHEASPVYIKRALELLNNVYLLANHSDQVVEFSVGHRHFSEVGNRSIAEGTMDAWLDEICLAMAARDWRCVELMTIMDESLVRLKDPFDIALVEFVNGVFSNSSALPELLQTVMEKSSPQYLESTRVPYVHSLFIPFVNVFVAIIDGDEAHYQEALRDALEAHYQFYMNEDVRYSPKGNVSLKLTGLAALAYDKYGWTIPEAAYLPKWLVYGEQDLLA
ncbi:immunity 49 family protein [Vibrio alginolyticus]|uniref:immunity 49 family protein n=1 Tax=Vibrio alginolyticus TaxID=663 RepID=UPI001BD35104|nr:immunity 49 family protein [Vibrio alginolyticus]MBT0024340.1 immunity 49 family protein [Vibrio alginolyticus]MCR9574771.1 immunity 49 family protein [Vibrio alginolyticus]ULF79121.1 immunity 49 family protein [Vibrio alginolyticus]